MAAVNVTVIGVLTHADGTTENVTLVGMASLTGLGVGGGPILPPDKPPSVGGGTPTFPIALPPGSWPPGGGPPGPGYPPSAEHPIVIPPIQLPPGVEPPPPPNPGDPTTALPPPAGQAGWPVQPIVVPPFIIVNYPGIGPVVVAPPAPAA